MKKTLFIIFIAVLGLSSGTLMAQSSSKDTLKKDNPILKESIILPSYHNFIYVLPPEKSFERDTNMSFFGLSSKKYPGVIFSITLPETGYMDDEKVIKQRFNILKQGIMRINNSFDLWYYKLSPKSNPEMISWSIFFKNEFFYGNGIFNYNTKDDKVLGKGIEKTINSFLIIQRPDLVPEQSSLAVGDFDAIPLKFVKKFTYPHIYFTEDGLPIDKTKGSKIFALATRNTSFAGSLEVFEQAVFVTNSILANNNIDDSIVVENIEPTQILEAPNGVKLTGSLKSNANRSFFSYYIIVPGKDLYFLVFGICNYDEREEFDKVLDDFRKSVARNMDF
ncbi:MAG: hypothetical protein FWG85_03660 [Bacteroidetes bacterium]|nr:hypothetical protein [Bacteroidota bacterium]